MRLSLNFILIFIPIISFVLLYIISFKMLNYMRLSFLVASMIWGVILTFSTEILNLFKIVNVGGVSVTWVSVTIILFIIYIRCKRIDFKYILASPSICAPLRTILMMVVAIVSIVGVIALIAPPNTWDSAAYHMARVAHWVQNQNVDHYAASYLPQLYQPPWAEFAIMHLQIISDCDRFANCIQWWSMIGSILGVSILAKLFGADIRGQIFTAAFAATIPMGIMQSSSTQNDYVVTFWLVCFVCFSLHWFNANREVISGDDLLHAMGVGMSLGLAILTKGTAYIYASPFVIWFAVLLVKQQKMRALQYSLLIAVMVLLLNVGHYTRNIILFGSPISVGSGEETITNKVYSLPAATSNIIRNISLHLGTPSQFINNKIYYAIHRVHEIMNIDVSDIRTTSRWGNFVIIRLNTYEDSAGNPVHLILIVLSIAVCFLWKIWKLHYRLLSYIFSLIAGFILFSVLLRWQPWHSRLQLPLFVLFSPLVGMILARIRPKIFGSVMVILICITALPWVFLNKTKLLLPASLVSVMRGPENIDYIPIWASDRKEQYFSHGSSRYLKEPYMSAAAYIKTKGISDIGLWLPYDPWEYQLWVMLKEDSYPSRIESVMVSNISKKLEPETFIPSAIIRVRKIDEFEIINELRTSKGVYLRQWNKGHVDIFIKEERYGDEG